MLLENVFTVGQKNNLPLLLLICGLFSRAVNQAKGDLYMEIRLGESIRKLRKGAGFTQEQLAEALGVSVSAVQNASAAHTQSSAAVAVALPKKKKANK